MGKYILRIANKNDIGAIVNISHTSLGYPCEQELVAEDAKRQGIGSLLIKEAEQWAAQHGIHFIRLNSGGTRADAHKFYRNLGFDNEKEQMRFIKTIDTGVVP